MNPLDVLKAQAGSMSDADAMQLRDVYRATPYGAREKRNAMLAIGGALVAGAVLGLVLKR